MTQIKDQAGYALDFKASPRFRVLCYPRRLEGGKSSNFCGGAVKRYCIIGAGACGLVVAKTFAERGIPYDCFEALGDVGGIWNPQSPHVVYGSTYLNSSKKLSKYPDYDFPEEWPHYLSRAQAQDYLRSYAREFGLYDHIKFYSHASSAVLIFFLFLIHIYCVS